MSTTVTYKGSTLTTINNQTKTLKTAGKYMEGDVVLVDVTESGSGSGVVWQDGQGYIHLSDEGDIELQTKTVTPTETAQTITADAGYYALEKVNVGAISSTYVGTGITRRSSSDLTASGATVTVPSGYYSAQASKAVANGTAGTPTAAKGTVNNHQVAVTPSVTNTTGYITGGTKTGTAITVSASELVSGTYNVTSSGTKDVTNYASASVPSGTEGAPTATKGTVTNHSVSVTPSVTNTSGYITGSTKTGTAVTVSASELVSGTKTITENGSGIDVTNYASVDVNVGSSVSTTHTATITRTGVYDTRTPIYCYVQHNYNVRYYTKGDTFSFTEGDTLTITLHSYNAQGCNLLVDGEVVFNDNSGYYTYTMPDHDIDIQLNASTGSVANASISETSNEYKLIASDTYSVNTSSTTEISVGTLETGDTSIWTSDKMIFVRTRAVSGRRNGYYYGSDAIIANNVLGSGLSDTESYLIYGTSYYQNSSGNLINYNLQRTSATGDISGYGIYPDKIYDDGSIDIKARYSSTNTLTINGKFIIEVYTLNWPNGTSPFFG